MAARSQKRTTKRKKTRLLLYGFNQDFNHNTGEYCVDNFLKGVNGVCMTMMGFGIGSARVADFNFFGQLSGGQDNEGLSQIGL